MLRIKLLHESVQPVHPEPYREGPKTKKLEKIEMDKMLNQIVAEPEQSERAAPVAIAPKMTELYSSAVMAED